jgi:hypothetical protein
MKFIYCCWCRRSLSTMHRVLPWKYNLPFCRAAKYLALLLTTIIVQYYEFVSLLIGMKNVSCYCNSKLPKTYTWSGTFILKDGRYTFLFLSVISGLSSPLSTSLYLVIVYGSNIISVVAQDPRRKGGWMCGPCLLMLKNRYGWVVICTSATSTQGEFPPHPVRFG